MYRVVYSKRVRFDLDSNQGRQKAKVTCLFPREVCNFVFPSTLQFSNSSPCITFYNEIEDNFLHCNA
jgi:hypothetical protein